MIILDIRNNVIDKLFYYLIKFADKFIGVKPKNGKMPTHVFLKIT